MTPLADDELPSGIHARFNEPLGDELSFAFYAQVKPDDPHAFDNIFDNAGQLGGLADIQRVVKAQIDACEDAIAAGAMHTHDLRYLCGMNSPIHDTTLETGFAGKGIFEVQRIVIAR